MAEARGDQSTEQRLAPYDAADMTSHHFVLRTPEFEIRADNLPAHVVGRAFDASLGVMDAKRREINSRANRKTYLPVLIVAGVLAIWLLGGRQMAQAAFMRN